MKPKNHRIEIGVAERVTKRNAFNFREVIGHKKPVNVIVMGRGYDSFGQALRAAKRFNAKLRDEFKMPIYHRGELVG